MRRLFFTIYKGLIIMKLWAGRFSKEADKKTNDFNSSIATDSRMFEEDINGSIAHATMLGEQKIISAKEIQYFYISG